MNDKLNELWSKLEAGAEPASAKHYDNDGNAVGEDRDESQGAGPAPEAVDGRALLKQIQAITADNAYIADALRSLDQMNTVGAQPNDGLGVAGKADAIGQIVTARETTNQQMLRLLEKMYDDGRSGPASEEGVRLEKFAEVCKALMEFKNATGGVSDRAIEVARELAAKMF